MTFVATELEPKSSHCVAKFQISPNNVKHVDKIQTIKVRRFKHTLVHVLVPPRVPLRVYALPGLHEPRLKT